MQTAIFCKFEGVYVRFIVEGTEDKDFFVSNIDINEMKLSNFSKEEEVLFLPLSCFEVINIDNENFYGHEIKVIKLNYLNKYKKIINDKFEELLKNQNGEEAAKFINLVINSNYSKEICKYLGYDFDNNFYKEIDQKIFLYRVIGELIKAGYFIFGGFKASFILYFASKISNILNEKKQKKEFIFYSNSFYYNYVPYKYREYSIPTMKWKDAPKDSKSFAIELIINDDFKNPSWLVINIPAKENEMEINEISNEGETVIEYRGIPENAFSITFFLYVFNIEIIEYQDFQNMKNGLNKDKDLMKNLIDYKMLVVS